MNILVTGANGFIASKIVSKLIAHGHDVTCCVKNIGNAKNKFPNTKIIRCDFEKDIEEKVWLDRFVDIDILINCVGILSSFFKKKIWKIHYETPRICFDAAVKKGVKKIIQISAFGVEQSETEYAKSKKAADEYLLNLNVLSIIVRPSMVYSTGSYGGSSFFRGLSALPYFIVVPGHGLQLLQPIFLEDVANGVLKIVNHQKIESQIINFVGPEKISLRNVLLRMRAWLGFKKAIVVNMPDKIIRVLLVLGDFFRFAIINSTSYSMLMQNKVATQEEQKSFFSLVMPKKMSKVFLENPSYTQDRWHAKLYFLRHFIRLSIAFVFIATGVTTVYFYPKEKTFELMNLIGLSSIGKNIVFYLASYVDIFLGFLTLINFKIKWVGITQSILVTIYTLFISILLPELWLHPLGPVIKNIPIIIAIFTMITLEAN